MRRILAIDGGGIRGTFPAAFLACLEDDLDRPLSDYFDLIAGTSTGGIIAIGLGLGLKARDILTLYEERGPDIFSQRTTGIRGWIERSFRKFQWYTWAPKYSSEELEKALVEVFGDRRIGEANTRLMIPAWHNDKQSVYIFKTAHHERFTTDYKDLARDAAMATAAAPSYFRQYVTARDIGLVDGGVWANNPTGPAVVEAIGTLGWDPSELKVLSVGCLDDVTEIQDAYGALRLTQKLAGLFMAGQSHGSLGIAHILTGHVGGSDHKAIYRISQSVPAGFYTLDDTSRIQKLKSRAYAEAREQKPTLMKEFFSAPVEPFEPIYEVPR